jgi:hypothetical protein
VKEKTTEKPTSGSHLAQILEVRPDEGVVLAVLTEELEEITTKEIPYVDKSGEYMHVVLAHSKAWGVRAMDVLPPNGEKVKWWKAKNMIADQKLQPIPVRWEGPISEIPQQYFDKGYVLAVRFYDSGPWFFPKEQPKYSVDPELVAAVEVAV